MPEGGLGDTFDLSARGARHPLHHAGVANGVPQMTIRFAPICVALGMDRQEAYGLPRAPAMDAMFLFRCQHRAITNKRHPAGAL